MTANMWENKVDRKSFQSGLENKINKEDLELKVNVLEFQTFSEELQGIIDDLLNKILTLVSQK